MATQKASAAYQLVRTVWDHSPRGSWLRLNQSLSGAVSLAIDALLPFDRKDFTSFFDGMRGGYWFGDSEHFYSRAVRVGHIGACQSFEAWANRKPFMVTGKRVAVGSEIETMSNHPIVTSITAEYVVACTHHRGTSKVATRQRLTRADLKRFDPPKKQKAADLERSA